MARLTAPRGLAPLRHRSFRRLAAGQFASNVGDACYAVALPWYVLAEHGGALLLGTVLVAYGVPRTVLLAARGHASDRWRPWTVTMSTVFQRWAPPDLLGRLTGLLLTASFGVFPTSVALAALVVHGLGAAAFFPLAAVTVAIPLLVGLSQRTWRDFGMTPRPALAPTRNNRRAPAAADIVGSAS
jgi:MFS family permease